MSAENQWPGQTGEGGAASEPAVPKAEAAESWPGQGPTLLQRLQEFGISPKEVEAGLTPIIAGVVAEQMKTLPDMLDNLVRHHVDQLSGKIIAELKAVLPGGGGPAQNGASSTVQTGIGNGSAIEQLLSMWMQKQAGGAGPAAGGGMNLDHMKSYADTFKSMWSTIVEPWMGVYGQGRTDMLQQLTSLSKMGVNMPWEPPATVPEAVNLHQDPQDGARNVAKSIKL